MAVIRSYIYIYIYIYISSKLFKYSKIILHRVTFFNLYLDFILYFSDESIIRCIYKHLYNNDHQLNHYN